MIAARTDRCPRCGHGEGKLGPERGPHIASLLCARCGHWLAWISKNELSDLQQAELTDALQRLCRLWT